MVEGRSVAAIIGFHVSAVLNEGTVAARGGVEAVSPGVVGVERQAVRCPLHEGNLQAAVGLLPAPPILHEVPQIREQRVVGPPGYSGCDPSDRGADWHGWHGWPNTAGRG